MKLKESKKRKRRPKLRELDSKRRLRGNVRRKRKPEEKLKNWSS